MASNPVPDPIPDPMTAYGWSAQPRKVDTLLSTRSTPLSTPAAPMTITHNLPLPTTPLATRTLKYARAELPPKTFKHSLRVYHYGLAIARTAFPSWLEHSSSSFIETYFLTCLLHDIGTTAKNITSTYLSFEFSGGFLALNLLLESGAPKAQAESVAEAVIRHQDLGETGTLTTVGALIQLATIFDNVGLHPELVHIDTIREVVGAYPREGWSRCFAETIRRENELKPWAHTTHLGQGEFPSAVLGNNLMEPFE